MLYIVIKGRSQMRWGLSLQKTGILDISICVVTIVMIILELCFSSIACATEEVLLDPATILDNMRKAFSDVYDYQVKVEVRLYRGTADFDTERFLYRFKKPDLIRIDVETPRAGTVLVYPDKNGKVVIRLPGFARFFPLRLSPDHFLLKGFMGQPIDKTDLGLLIENIGHSLDDQPYRTPNIEEQDGNIIIQVIAQDHFREGVITNYRFFIDTKLWLPIRVEESKPDGRLERTIAFYNLRINTGFSDRIFTIDRTVGHENGKIE